MTEKRLNYTDAPYGPIHRYLDRVHRAIQCSLIGDGYDGTKARGLFGRFGSPGYKGMLAEFGMQDYSDRMSAIICGYYDSPNNRRSIAAKARRDVIEPFLFVIAENDKNVRQGFKSVCDRAADILNEIHFGDEPDCAAPILRAAKVVLDTGLILPGELKGTGDSGFSGDTFRGYFEGIRFKDWLAQQHAIADA